MDKYIPITRKYRPKTFAAVCHQDAVVTTLKNALKSGRVAQSYLFSGIRGTGKTTLARLLAKALNCENLSSEFEPCNQCRSCREIDSGNALDVIEIDGASNRGIDDIRQINDTVGYAPNGSKWKIYIIDEVHMLTKEAFNALLKTLEEPPPRVKFLFATTEPHKILPTILSRCQRFDLSRLNQDSIVLKLRSISEDIGRTAEPSALELIAQLADGSMRDAESLFDQITCFDNGPITHTLVQNMLGLAPRTLFFQLDTAVNEHNLAAAFDLAQIIFDSGKDLKHFLDHLIHHYRLILRLHLGQRSLLGALPTEERAGYENALTIYTHHHCLDILDYLVQWLQQIPSSPFKHIDLEMVLLFIIRIKDRIPFDSLIERLNQLEGKLPEPSPTAEIEREEPQPVEPVAPEPPQALKPEVPDKPIPVEDKIPTIPEPTTQEAPKLESSIVREPAEMEKPSIHQSHYDTLMRFAAVELNGSLNI
ncbi:MAG: DNA polymerase III subunit gamma/tau [Chlamydiia bacterium]|nr:DNA polymerase III subunit gamma/tau [Chlamydiia bacterium]